MNDDQRKVELSFEDLRHIFDLAVDSPTVCSGSFENDDVELLRRLAAMIGVDPNEITPDEFLNNYVHRFMPPIKPRYGSWNRMSPADFDAWWEEERAGKCTVRRCGKGPEDPKHEYSWKAPNA